MHKLIAVLLALFALNAQAATIAASSCQQAAVESAIAAAANGDTVSIPAGACTWGTIAPIAKQIKITGAPALATVITASGAGNILTLTIGSQFRTEIANLKFLPGSATGTYLIVNGAGLPPYMHDMSFNLPNFQLQHAVEWRVTGGVISKTIFESTQNLGGACGTQIGSESGSIVVKPGVPWNDASTMGMNDVNGDKNLYLEDNVFSNVGQMPDLDDNARAVLRHNTIISSSLVMHGTTGPQGARHVEVYDNTFSLPNKSRAFNRWLWFRAGTGVITGNVMDAMTGQCYGNKPSVMFTVENAQRSDGGHGCCTGYMCWHQPGSGSDGTAGHNNLSAGQSPASAYQISEPVYIWGNTGPGAAENLFVMGEGEPAQCGTSHTTAEFFKRDRDYFLNAGAKPGWTRYTYPHPITTGAITPPIPPVIPPTGPLTKFGETAVLPSTGLLNACVLIGQPATLAISGTLKSLAFYSGAAGGQAVMALYNASGALVASTAQTAVVSGWNDWPVLSTVALAPATYRITVTNPTGAVVQDRYGITTYGGVVAGGNCAPPGSMPGGNAIVEHWSMYGTVEGAAAPALPAPTNPTLVIVTGSATPYVRASVSASATQCGFYVDDLAPVMVPAAGGSCQMSAGGMSAAQGTHVVAVDARAPSFTNSPKTAPFYVFTIGMGLYGYGVVTMQCDAVKCTPVP